MRSIRAFAGMWLFLSLGLSVHADNSIPVHQSLSATTFRTAEADWDGDMEGGNRSSGAITGTFGKATFTAQADIAPWDESTYCEFDPDTGAPVGIEFVWLTSTIVTIQQNGDQLVSKLSSSPPSISCYNFVEDINRFKLFHDIQGGTGKFAGATGTTVMEGETRRVDGTDQDLFWAWTAELKGTVNLP